MSAAVGLSIRFDTWMLSQNACGAGFWPVESTGKMPVLL